MVDGALLDNDVILKCAIFEVAVWDKNYLHNDITFATLTSTKFVVRKILDRRFKDLNNAEGSRSRLATFLSSMEFVEPDAQEVTFAAELEAIAQSGGMLFDTGEALLISMMILRPFKFFITGDKRAIKCLPRIGIANRKVCEATKRIICFELFLKRILELKGYENLRFSICGEASADNGLAVIFQCVSPAPTVDEANFGLESNLREISNTADEYLADEVVFLTAPS